MSIVSNLWTLFLELPTLLKILICVYIIGSIIGLISKVTRKIALGMIIVFMLYCLVNGITL